MSELLSVLNNKRSLRVLLREAPASELESLKDKFASVVDELIAEEQARAEEENAKHKLLEAKVNELKANGIAIEDLIQALQQQQGSSTRPKTKAKRAPRPAKYTFTDGEGNSQTWTGQGRTPKALQQQLDNGAALEDFLI